MSLYEINPVKTLTIEALVHGSFPAIKATDDQALPFVGPRTVAYIHALIVDTVTVLQTKSPNAEALRNEAMLRQELEKMKPAVMSKQLQRCFEAYYEDILKIRENEASSHAQAVAAVFRGLLRRPLRHSQDPRK